MWMIDPETLCTRHLVAEHFEIHKMVGNLRRSGKWAKSLARLGFLEPRHAMSRHFLLAQEMLRRGFRHESPLDTRGAELPEGTVDVDRSVRDLKKRCGACGRNLKR